MRPLPGSNLKMVRQTHPPESETLAVDDPHDAPVSSVPTAPNDRLKPHAIIPSIMGLLVVWGGYLAVGAWRAGGDQRKAWIIVSCTSGFLALWWLVLRQLTRRDQRSKMPSDEPIWNTGSLLSFGLLPIIGLGLLWDFWLGDWTGQRAQMLRFAMLGLMMTAMVAAAVGLSDPRPLRGKLLGLISLAFCIVSGMAAMVLPL